MSVKVESIKVLGKEELIKLAKQYLDVDFGHLQINFEEFNISVWANSINVLVKFNRKVHYTPLRYKGTEPPFYTSNISFDLSVDIISTTECQLNTWRLKDFFVPTANDLENLAFIEEHFGLYQAHFKTAVSEEENHFFNYLK